ncbi:AAA family ATPase [Anaerocolumna aminovalerica]|uniref:Shikimate kinase n=1 Tax=Anaerocolumna aminovalerica TaxID=1527 RepID=A0A1I5D2H3_9FIRM|nr:AAA family ATPase [Anaerocolumna aminovalerica]MBU5331368.1 AAA family ATPase [Anaerocolumna aminovalerica]MDU6266143.1 AAA family ATPase [Anaerocolumna aminovalerica]SFN93081.1 Shikimate kinase [Anaerocolumna aminovalerica]
MKLIIIFGPHAVGKMTVGQELAKITGLKLFHNHMTIDIVSDLFTNMPQERGRLTELFRKEIFEAYSKSDEYGMIFTFMWAFDSQDDWNYINGLEEIFRSRNAEVYYVELEADYELRIERNKTENRLFNKPSKRNIKKSEELFRILEDKYRLNSFEGEIQKENYIRINNSDINPDIVAEMIKSRFSL